MVTVTVKLTWRVTQNTQRVSTESFRRSPFYFMYIVLLLQYKSELSLLVNTTDTPPHHTVDHLG